MDDQSRCLQDLYARGGSFPAGSAQSVAKIMNEFFSLALQQWSPTEYGPDEVRQTSGFLRIRVQNRSATQVYDVMAKSVRDTVLVSCYPLAIWLASSWWRLCWEPIPKTTPHTDWLLSHEMHGAGHGFLWPRMRFESDGETVSVICTAAAESSEPIQYMTSCHESIPIRAFAEAIESFIQTVLSRLDVIGIQNTELHTLWHAVTTERGDRGITFHRQLEAMMGFDPDEAPDHVADVLLRLSEDAGESAALEIAAACARQDPSLILDDIRKSMDSDGITGSFSGIPNLSVEDVPDLLHRTPWDRGRAVARAVRAVLGNQMDPIPEQQLCDLFGLRTQDLTTDSASTARVPWGLAIRQAENNQMRLLFRHRGPRGRKVGQRFDMARWLGDHLSAPVRDRWLPATEMKTARQKMQRAFAAEFLAPIDAIQSFLEGDLTDEDRIEEAGEYFNVSSSAVKSQLLNHGLVPPETARLY